MVQTLMTKPALILPSKFPGMKITNKSLTLYRGFQPIGTFHKIGAARFGMGMAGR